MIRTAKRILFVLAFLALILAWGRVDPEQYECATDSECVAQCMDRGASFEECDDFMGAPK